MIKIKLLLKSWLIRYRLLFCENENWIGIIIIVIKYLKDVPCLSYYWNMMKHKNMVAATLHIPFKNNYTMSSGSDHLLHIN